MVNADGVPVAADLRDMALGVRISAPGVAPDRLRTLVEESYRYFPVSDAQDRAVPVSLRIDINGG